jgi:hypothetical protein
LAAKTGASPRRGVLSGETGAVYSSGIDLSLIQVKPVSGVVVSRTGRASNRSRSRMRLTMARNRLYGSNFRMTGDARFLVMAAGI